jgi:hypothetical protein
VKEWTLTFPREIPLWELKSQRTLEFSKNNCRGQNSVDWIFFYIIRNLLKLKCLKWVRMTHLDTLNTSYGQKKSWESNWQFDSWPLKVRNCLNFPRVQVACNIPLESCQQGLQLYFKTHLNQRFACKVMEPQSRGSPSCGNFKTPIWESRDKMTFGCWYHGQAHSIL